MATIVNNPKYGEGHQVVLRDKISPTAKAAFVAERYVPGKTVFSITRKQVKVKKTIRVGKGENTITLYDPAKNPVAIVGGDAAINDCFNHFTNNAKSTTTTLTRIKEEVSMLVFEGYFEYGNVPTEDEILYSFDQSDQDHYDTTYYESAVKQLMELRKYVKGGGYTYERQGANKTKLLYEKARKLSGLQNDNWNPADVWMIKDSIRSITDVIGDNPDDIKIINIAVANAFKERTIIPISLKQVTAPRAISQVIDPNNIGKKRLDIDMNFSRVDLSETFNNFIVQAKSGFAARVGYKASSTTLNVSIEGRFVGAGYQLGAVDAKKYKQYCLDNYSYTLRSTANVSEGDIELAKKELQKIFQLQPRISNTIDSYDAAIKLVDKGDELTRKRFANLISYLYSFMVAPGRKFEEHMEYCYYSSTKQSKDACSYLVLK